MQHRSRDRAPAGRTRVARFARRATPAPGGPRSTRSSPPRAAPTTSCRRSCAPSKRAPPSARSPTRCGRSSASTRRSMSDTRIRDPGLGTRRSGVRAGSSARKPEPRTPIPIPAFSRPPHHRLRSGRTVRAGGHRRQLRASRRARRCAWSANPGSGKSLTALSIMRLVQPPGRIASGQHPLQGARSAGAHRARDAAASAARRSGSSSRSR